MLFDACAFNLSQIGESVCSLDGQFIERYPDIPKYNYRYCNSQYLSIEPQKAIVLSVIVSFHKITNTILGISYSTGEICPICETAGKSTAIVEACLTSSGRHPFIARKN